MKVLHIIDSGGLYGAEVMLLNLVQEQLRLGLDPVICSIGEKGVFEKPLESEGLKRGFKIIKFRMRAGPNLLGAYKILRFAHNGKFDLMHTHGYKGNIFFGLLLRGLRRIPLVSTLHGWASTSTPSKLKFYEWLAAKSFKHVDAVIAVNRQLLSNPKLKKNDLHNLWVVNNGIAPINSSTSMKLDSMVVDFCRKGFVIGSLGRLSREKGFHHLIEAVSKLRRKDTSIRLIIIGEGSERRFLETQISQNGLKDYILLPGFKPYAHQYLPFFKIFVLPSLKEGLPIGLLEAMHYSCPIVATRVGGIPEVLDYGSSGILVEPGDDIALENALWELYKNPDHASELANNAKGIVQKRYSSEKMALEYYEIYKSIKSF